MNTLLKSLSALIVVATIADVAAAQTVIRTYPSSGTVIYTGPSRLVYPNNPTIIYASPPMVTTYAPVQYYSPNVIYQQPVVYSLYPVYSSGLSIGIGGSYGRPYGGYYGSPYYGGSIRGPVYGCGFYRGGGVYIGGRYRR